MPIDFQRSRRPGGSTLDGLGRTGPAPGKRTLVEATRFPAAPIQRKTDAAQPDPLPPPPIGSPVVYQYGAGTTAGRDNDCGPACVWMVIRMMGYEAQLDAYILANRPDHPTYRATYFGDPDATPPPAPTLQERLDLARRCGDRDEDVSPMPAQATADATMYVVQPSTVPPNTSDANLRTSLVRLLRLLGVTKTDAELIAMLPLMSEGEDKLWPTQIESGASPTQDQLEGNAQLLAFIRRHVRGDSAVIVLGQPSSGTKANPVDTAWGWGGDFAQEHGAHTSPSALGGHFVIVDDFDPETGKYTVFDPSYNQPRRVPGDQLVAFVDAYIKGRSVNVLTIPTAELRALVAEVQTEAAAPTETTQPKRGDAAGAATAPPASGPGTPLPAPTLDKMQRAFAADFAGVRVHVDGGAAAAVGALAFARGDDLHFAPGQYRPGTADGDALIGHELAHVVQQRAGRVSGAGVVDDAGLETEADREGARAAAMPTTAAVT